MSELTLPPCPTCGQETTIVLTLLNEDCLAKYLKCKTCQTRTPPVIILNGDSDAAEAKLIDYWTSTSLFDTNADMVRNLSNQELATLLLCPDHEGLMGYGGCLLGEYGRYNSPSNETAEICYQCKCDWLNQGRSFMWGF